MGTTGKDVLEYPDGTQYHLGVKPGDLYPRMIQVGSFSRAEAIAAELTDVQSISSSRGFRIYSGRYKNVGISILATGMGAPMMDMFVREATNVLPEASAIIRIGTCGVLDLDTPTGGFIICDKAAYVYSNYAYFDKGSTNAEEAAKGPPYIVTKPVLPSASLTSGLAMSMSEIRADDVYTLAAASAETFYATQGRRLPYFDDENTTLVDDLTCAGIGCLDMEVHQLFHLALKRTIKCHAAALLIGVVHRMKEEPKNISHEELIRAEREAGLAALNTLASFDPQL